MDTIIRRMIRGPRNIFITSFHVYALLARGFDRAQIVPLERIVSNDVKVGERSGFARRKIQSLPWQKRGSINRGPSLNIAV